MAERWGDSVDAVGRGVNRADDYVGDKVGSDRWGSIKGFPGAAWESGKDFVEGYGASVKDDLKGLGELFGLRKGRSTQFDLPGMEPGRINPDDIGEQILGSKAYNLGRYGTPSGRDSFWARLGKDTAVGFGALGLGAGTAALFGDDDEGMEQLRDAYEDALDSGRFEGSFEDFVKVISS